MSQRQKDSATTAAKGKPNSSQKADPPDLQQQLAQLTAQMSALTQSVEDIKKGQAKKAGQSTKEVKEIKKLNKLIMESDKDPSSILSGLKKARKGIEITQVPITFSVSSAATAEASLLNSAILDLKRILAMVIPVTSLLKDYEIEEHLIDHLEETPYLMLARGCALASLLSARCKLRLWTLQAQTHGESVKKETRDMIIATHWEDNDIVGMTGHIQKAATLQRATAAQEALAKSVASSSKPPSQPKKRDNYVSIRKDRSEDRNKKQRKSGKENPDEVE